MVRVCGQMNRADALLDGGTHHPLPGVQSAPLRALLTLGLHLRKGGSGVREGGERGKEEAPS